MDLRVMELRIKQWIPIIEDQSSLPPSSVQTDETSFVEIPSAKAIRHILSEPTVPIPDARKELLYLKSSFLRICFSFALANALN